MSVPLDELLDTLETELDYPVETQAVVRQIGSLLIEAPDQEDSETVAEVLEPVGEETFNSPEALFEELLSNLSDGYIGRKFYDDRGANFRDPDVSMPRDELDESF